MYLQCVCILCLAAILLARSSPPWVTVDRPFLFLIRHNPTGTVFCFHLGLLTFTDRSRRFNMHLQDKHTRYITSSYWIWRFITSTRLSDTNNVWLWVLLISLCRYHSLYWPDQPALSPGIIGQQRECIYTAMHELTCTHKHARTLQ